MPSRSRRRKRGASSVWQVDAARSLRTCSAEDLIVQKSFAGREQDWIDVPHTIERRADLLDPARILAALRRLLELKEDLSAPVRLQQLLSAR